MCPSGHARLRATVSLCRILSWQKTSAASWNASIGALKSTAAESSPGSARQVCLWKPRDDRITGIDNIPNAHRAHRATPAALALKAVILHQPLQQLDLRQRTQSISGRVLAATMISVLLSSRGQKPFFCLMTGCSVLRRRSPQQRCR